MHPDNLDEIEVRLVGLDELDALRAELATDVWRPACDTETVYRPELEVDGIPGAVRVISLSVLRADGSESAWVIDLRDTPAAAVAELMASLDVVGFNANFDEHALLRSGISVASWYDAMLADSVCRIGRTGVNWYRSLAQLAKVACGIELDGKGSIQLSYDAESDLTADQVRYAGLDAVVTRRVADWVRARVSAARLDEAVELEQGARPFINAMMINGVPFDLDGYLDDQITAKQAEVASCLAKLAELTEPRGEEQRQQLALFAVAEEAAPGGPVPSWNPNSKPDLIMALNKWSEAEVKKFTGGRLLQSTDSLRKDEMKQISGEIAETVLRLKAAAKEVTTYGGDLRKYWRNGRFFSRYKQALISTGRLASFNFNAQNMSKKMLPWMKAPEGRLFVYGDIGQAELRTVAHYAGEEEMAAAFASGEDFHLATARVMNPGVDFDVIAESDPVALKKMRTAAKAVNFGLVYGMAAGKLSTSLTVAGVPTDRKAAQGYLDAYFAARPNVSRWLAERDAYVDGMSRQLPRLDWRSTFELYELRTATEPLRKTMRKSLGRFPSELELAQAAWPHGPNADDPITDPEALAAFHAAKARRVQWARGFEGAVVLTADGVPFEFFSTTLSGRRRYFDIPLDPQGNDKFSGVITSAVLSMCSSRKSGGQAYVAEFALDNGLTLPAPEAWRRDRLQARADTVKAFEGAQGKVLRYAFVTQAIERFGLEAMTRTFDKAASDVLRSFRNQYRNHPIQGSVADVVEASFASIIAGLPEGAFPILSVHDSVVIECDAADADRVAWLIKEAVDASMQRFCPTVVPKVDVDVRTSLADDDVLYELGSEGHDIVAEAPTAA